MMAGERSDMALHSLNSVTRSLSALFSENFTIILVSDAFEEDYDNKSSQNPGDTGTGEISNLQV